MTALLKAVASPGMASWATRAKVVGRGGNNATTKLTRAAAVPAQATSSSSSAENHGGTVYPVPSTGVMKYSNVDGGRINDGRYTAFKDDVTKALRIPEERVYTDPVKTFAYGRGLTRVVFSYFCSVASLARRVICVSRKQRRESALDERGFPCDSPTSFT